VFEKQNEHRLETKIHKHLKLLDGTVSNLQVHNRCENINKVWVCRLLTCSLLWELWTNQKGADHMS